jgi:hypothetical protein
MIQGDDETAEIVGNNELASPPSIGMPNMNKQQPVNSCLHLANNFDDHTKPCFGEIAASPACCGSRRWANSERGRAWLPSHQYGCGDNKQSNGLVHRHEQHADNHAGWVSRLPG